MAIEEHGNGKQMVRFRSRPIFSIADILLMLVPALLAAVALYEAAWAAATVLGLISALLVVRQVGDKSVAMTSFVRALDSLRTSAAEAAVEID